MGVLIKPMVTEKMTAITDKFNRFGFIVRPEANKLEIKSRYTKAGFVKGRTIAVKKAIVTLKEGDTIDFYSNI